MAQVGAEKLAAELADRTAGSPAPRSSRSEAPTSPSKASSTSPRPSPALGLVWSAITYVLRFYLNVLLEPKYNPVKHFPAVTVGHKLVLPFSVQLSEAFAAVLGPLGPVAANGIAVKTVFLLPGLFGFLAWELKENWRLYPANAPADLRPSVIGSHGESMRRLLAPGFHSGTVPKAFAKLRRRAHVRGLRWARARAHAQLHHVEEALTRWLDRGPLALTAASMTAAVRAATTAPI